MYETLTITFWILSAMNIHDENPGLNFNQVANQIWDNETDLATL